jgi:hypothetical protein
LRPLGVQVNQLPISPRVIVEAMRTATPTHTANGIPA